MRVTFHNMVTIKAAGKWTIRSISPNWRCRKWYRISVSHWTHFCRILFHFSDARSNRIGRCVNEFDPQIREMRTAKREMSRRLSGGEHKFPMPINYFAGWTIVNFIGHYNLISDWLPTILPLTMCVCVVFSCVFRVGTILLDFKCVKFKIQKIKARTKPEKQREWIVLGAEVGQIDLSEKQNSQFWLGR